MIYFLTWIWLGALGVVIDLIRHRKDFEAARLEGAGWTLFEIVFLGVVAILFGPILLVIPFIKKVQRDSWGNIK